jgi:hypothetical protein
VEITKIFFRVIRTSFLSERWDGKKIILLHSEADPSGKLGCEKIIPNSTFHKRRIVNFLTIHFPRKTVLITSLFLDAEIFARCLSKKVQDVSYYS